MLTPSSPRPPRLRFTLAGLFVMTLGVAIGLAWWRLPFNTVPSALFAGFGTWLWLGMLQRAWHGLVQLRESNDQPGPVRFGLILHIACALGMVALISLVGCVDIAARYEWSGMEGSHPEFRWTTRRMIDATFFLGIVCVYWLPRPRAQTRNASRTFFQSTIEGAAVIAGLCWLVVALYDAVAITGLVHISIRGVEVAQPTRWAGKDFYPANLHRALTGQTIYGAVAAMLLLAGAGVSTLLMVRLWRWGAIARFGFLALTITCLVAAGLLGAWFQFVAFPEFSPFMAEATVGRPLVTWMLSGTLVLAAATTAAYWIVAEPVGSESLARCDTPRPTCLHEHSGAVLACLVAVIMEIAVAGWRNFYNPAGTFWPGWSEGLFWLVNFYTSDPNQLLHVACVIVLARFLWQTRTGTSTDWMSARAVELPRYATLWFILLITLILIGPIGAWLGFVMTLQAWTL